MHNDTNEGILPKPSDAETKMATFSKYYNYIVTKGGVAIQLYRWERLLELYTGTVVGSITPRQ